MDEIARILADQAGVIARRQVLGVGQKPHDIARMLRRKEWAPVHEGVFVDHTGEPTWLQRAWAGVLFSWPAALSHDSAMRATEGPGRRDRDESVIHVTVDRGRHLVAPEGVRLHRVSGFGVRTLWNLGPPRIRYEHAVLDVAADAVSDLDAIGVLADACGARRTTAARLLKAVQGRTRLSRRSWLVDVLGDVAAGTCSVLEHGYLTNVEGPPRSARRPSTGESSTSREQRVPGRRLRRSGADRRAGRACVPRVGPGQGSRHGSGPRCGGGRSGDGAGLLRPGLRAWVLDGSEDRGHPPAAWLAGRGEALPGLWLIRLIR